MKALAVVVVSVLLLVAWTHWRTSRIEHELEPAASAVAGRSTTVDCQGFWANLFDVQWRKGEVQFDASGVPQSKLFLTRDICKRLHAFAGERRHQALDCLATVDVQRPQSFLGSPCYERAMPTVYALLVLAHESYHTAGVVTESTTNCYAIQALAYVAEKLGAQEHEARLAADAMAAVEPFQPEGYATSECRAGTQLDLHPDTPSFPTELHIAAPMGLRGTLR